MAPSSKRPCPTAVALAADPAMQAWMARLEEVVRAMPEGVRAYIACNTIEIMDRCPEGSEGDPTTRARHIVGSVEAMKWDGGDW